VAGAMQRGVNAPAPATILLTCLRGPADTLRELCGRPGIDWPRVAREALAHRVTPLVLEALQSSGVLADRSVPPTIVAELRLQRRRQVALAVRLDAALAEILPALRAVGAPVIVLKGLAVAQLYPAPALRPRSDLDLLIDPADWPAAEQALEAMGYHLLEAAHARRPRLSPVQNPEDRQYYRAADGLLIEAHADVLSTGLRRAGDALVWRRAELATVRGPRGGTIRTIPVLSPGDTFLHLATHLQRHAYTRLLWFYDLWLLLRAEGERIAWDEVARQAQRAGVATAAYYAWRNTDPLLGPAAPPRARDALRPNPLRRRLHEGMWPRRRILALDVEIIPLLDAMQAAHQLPPTVFDAYDSPQRMLSHLLLSGNVWPKSRVLARRLLPPEEWLRHHGPARVGHYRARLVLAHLLRCSTGQDTLQYGGDRAEGRLGGGA